MSIVLVLKINFLILTHDNYEALMSLNPGFSSARNLLDDGSINQTTGILDKTAAIIEKGPMIIKHLFDQNAGSNLPVLKIEIKFKNLMKINDDRVGALKQNFLDSPEKVKAKIIFENKAYDAKIRLKGDLPDHWLSKYRFSLAVDLKGGRTIMGMSSFAIQKPRSRQHPYEQAFQRILSSLGNLTTVHHYALVEVNGQKWGIMNVEEALSSEFLEKKRRKDSLIFRFSDDLYWKNYRKNTTEISEQDLLTSSEYLLSDDRLSASVVDQNKYLQDENYRKVYTYVLEKRLEKTTQELYSLEGHINLLLASFLWNNFHTMSVHNTRYYFNPYTLKLEPISSDQEAFSAFSADLLNVLEQADLPSHFYGLFDDGLRPIFEQTMDKVVNQFLKIHDELNFYSDIFPLDNIKKTDVLDANISEILKNKNEVTSALMDLKNSNTQINRSISEKAANGLLRHVQGRHYDNGEIHIYPLIDDSLVVSEILVDGENILDQELYLPGINSGKRQPYILKTGLTGVMDDKIFIETKYKGNIRLTEIGPSLISSEVFNPFEHNKLTNSEIFEPVAPGISKIKTGTYNINEPINFEGHLIIEPGVNLFFSEESYFLVSGTIEVMGTKKHQVTFSAQSKTWKGFYLKSNAEKSKINHLVVRHTSRLNAGILDLTGGFNIYNSDIFIFDLELDNTQAEDAINIVNSKININFMHIRDTVSDAFDCDFCEGYINNSSIIGSGGDGFDFSGSSVYLKEVFASEIKDKALSAGENSNLTISDSYFSNIGVGIASKDGSSVTGKTLSIREFSMYAGMTYQKKSIFSPFSSLKLTDIKIDDMNSFKRQFGTELIVDGKEVRETNINVKDMYSAGVMLK